MNILALIPARGGSKRVPNKNIRNLGNKPLINWTIERALSTPELSKVIVSTDDPIIAEIAESAGANVPWLRPKELAGDRSSSADVAIHAIDWYEEENGKIDGVLLLQPTSPFRTIKTIQRAINLFKEFEGSSLVGVSLARNHPLYRLDKEDKFLVPCSFQTDSSIKSQEFSQIYEINGAIYLISPNELRLRHSFIGKNLRPVITNSPIESLDLDTELDFKIAESFLSLLDNLS
jgi:CMP-N-acetylneuraminic acid synthetase